MKTIEERAKEFASSTSYNTCTKGVYQNRYDAYINIASGQREIDIQRACEWLSNKLQQDSYGETYLYFKYCDEQDFINDFKQTMKGE